jgi:hypothetical protein
MGAQPSTSDQAGSQADAFAGEGSSLSGLYSGNVSSTGSGLAAATTAGTTGGGRFAGTATNSQAGFTLSQTPIILPGLFTAMSVEPARPMDRVFASYGYFDKFNVNRAGVLSPGFNLNLFTVGAEVTFMEGRGSIYARAPFLYAADNTSGQPIDGIGDVSAGIKFALLCDRETGSALSAGMTVAAPTGRDSIVTTSRNSVLVNGVLAPGPFTFTENGTTLTVPGPTTTRINPTFLQPWLGGVLVMDRLFVQEYLGLVVPTDDRVSTFINNDVGVGYRVYCNQGSLLSSITPTVDAQFLLPLNHQGTGVGTTGNLPLTVPPGGTTTFPSVNPGPLTVNSPYQVFVSGALQFGLADRALLSTGIVTPVVGPKAYSVGFNMGFNLFF